MNYRAGRAALTHTEAPSLERDLWLKFYYAGPVTFDELFQGYKPTWAVEAYKMIKAKRWVEVDDDGVVRCLQAPK